MKDITTFKLSQKEGNKYLWAVCDEFGHTIIQVWSEFDPIDEVKLMLT